VTVTGDDSEAESAQQGESDVDIGDSAEDAAGKERKTRQGPITPREQNRLYRRRQLALVFKRMDLDKSGDLGPEEFYVLGNYRRKLGQKEGEWTHEQNMKLIQRLDTDGDGTIDLSEFVKYFNGILAKPRDEFDFSMKQFNIVADHWYRTQEIKDLLESFGMSEGRISVDDLQKLGIELGLPSEIIQALLAKREALLGEDGTIDVNSLIEFLDGALPKDLDEFSRQMVALMGERDTRDRGEEEKGQVQATSPSPSPTGDGRATDRAAERQEAAIYTKQLSMMPQRVTLTRLGSRHAYRRLPPVHDGACHMNTSISTPPHKATKYEHSLATYKVRNQSPPRATPYCSFGQHWAGSQLSRRRQQHPCGANVRHTVPPLSEQSRLMQERPGKVLR